jgi:hypothetical protein
MSLIYQMLICQDSINQLQDSEMFRVRTKEMCSRNVINFSFYSFLSSKEIAIQKQTSCKYRIFKSSENSFVQTIRHWTDPKKLFVSDDNILKVTDEWKLLSMDQCRHSLSYKRVDHFWREVFSQTASNDTWKYPTVTGVLRWLWEGLGFQKKKILRKLTWCKQQKRKTSKEKSYSERRTMIIFFVFQWTMKTIYYNSISIFSL